MKEPSPKNSGLDHFFHVEYKLWLERNGAIFGDGLFKLLSNVSLTGSISQAAREMGMSYRAAWGKIRLAEKHLCLPLVVTRVGGEAGGGTTLTPEADELLKRFRRLRQEVQQFVGNIYKEIFEGWPSP